MRTKEQLKRYYQKNRWKYRGLTWKKIEVKYKILRIYLLAIIGYSAKELAKQFNLTREVIFYHLSKRGFHYSRKACNAGMSWGKHINHSTANMPHIKWSRKIKKRDGRQCQLCGNWGNCAHHIDYDPENFDEQNGITVCRSCHAKTNTLKRRNAYEVLFKLMINCKYAYMNN